MNHRWAALLVAFAFTVSAGSSLEALDQIFADGFELGHPCRWSSVSPSVDCAAAEITVLLPGDVPLILVLIPGGMFMMGSPAGERGRGGDEELHQVTLTQAHYVGKTEVTQAQWEAVMGTPMPSTCGSMGTGSGYPVYCVSWTDVAGSGGFIERLNTYLSTAAFRLPTEAEWERAARAGNQYRFSHGDVLECDDSCGWCPVHEQFMWWCGNNTPLGSKPVGWNLANGYGLYDIHGNLWEWVQDWYGSNLGTSPVTDPTGPVAGTYRVLRGGDWNNDARYCRSAERNYYLPGSRYGIVGFRVARTAP